MALTEIIQQKIFNQAQELAPALARWKRAGEKVVFTNGCFDLMHRGHIDSLTKAADMGERLVVGLNSDASVRNIKGESRPIIDQQSRAFFLASLLVVDAVVLFDDETPYELIKVVVPDVLVKGSDYEFGEIAGSDIVLAAGGKVERVELTPGFSTTGLIDKIKDYY